MRRCNMSYAQIQTYLRDLVDLKLLTVTDENYQVTERGQGYIRAFQHLDHCLTCRFERGHPTYPEIEVTRKEAF